MAKVRESEVAASEVVKVVARRGHVAHMWTCGSLEDRDVDRVNRLEDLVASEMGFNVQVGHEDNTVKYGGLIGDLVLMCEVGHNVCPAPNVQLINLDFYDPERLAQGPVLNPNLGIVFRQVDGPSIGQDPGMVGGSLPGQLMGPRKADLTEENIIKGNDPPIIGLPPAMEPPQGFSWLFLAGVWAFVPTTAVTTLRVDSGVVSNRIWLVPARFPTLVSLLIA